MTWHHKGGLMCGWSATQSGGGGGERPKVLFKLSGSLPSTLGLPRSNEQIKSCSYPRSKWNAVFMYFAQKKDITRT